MPLVAWLKLTSSITVQFSRYDSELRAHRMGPVRPKSHPILIISPQSIGFYDLFALIQLSALFQLCCSSRMPPTRGPHERTMEMIHTAQFMVETSHPPGLTRKAMMVKNNPAPPAAR